MHKSNYSCYNSLGFEIVPAKVVTQPIIVNSRSIQV